VNLYTRLILTRPAFALAAILAVLCISGLWIKDFRLDASSDSLILEHDADLRYFRSVAERYASREFVVVLYRPHESLFSEHSLARLKQLRDDLRKLPNVESVVSLLDVPLLKNPPGPLTDLGVNIKTLESPQADLQMAVAEFGESPLYQDLLVSADLKSAALQVNFPFDPVGTALVTRRADLIDQRREAALTAEEQEQLKRVEAEYRVHKDRLHAAQHAMIQAIRGVLDDYRGDAGVFLGGVPMIADDMISFVKSDIRVFGIGMFCFLIVTLGIIFRRVRWIVLPMLCCAASVIAMIGLLGLLQWDVTVVSSNFISLQLIFTMALAIHIVVRYRELHRARPDALNLDLVRDAVRLTFVPCLYSVLTTMAGFCSLVVCDILPVVNFGWMMILGLGVSLTLTFLLLPAVLALLPKLPASDRSDPGAPLTAFFARLTERRGPLIVGLGIAVVAATAAGIARLEVENSFINYFKPSTEIYRGMRFLDENFGGTTPLEILIDFESEDSPPQVVVSSEDADSEFEMFDEFEAQPDDAGVYWFTQTRLDRITKVHDYLDGLPALGKVLSLATLMKSVEDLNGGQPLDNFTMAVLFGAVPGAFQEAIIDPYVSVENNQARITTRIKDSMASLRRNALLEQIRSDLVNKLGFQPGEARLSGVMVLYNNMLQSLFRSQVETVGITAGALLVMFLLLFRSLKIALIAMLPNLVAAMSVLGVMGLAGLPLDMMTITIVAISLGIAVDNTIHYLHRFRREVAQSGDYLAAMHRSHGSIGYAMSYTSLTITAGFSIFAFSNFIPTVLFGLLTALAMLVALAAALSLLPRLLIIFRPFGS